MAVNGAQHAYDSSVNNNLNTQRATGITPMEGQNSGDDGRYLAALSTNISVYANEQRVGFIQDLSPSESRTITPIQELGTEGVVQMVASNTNGGTLSCSRVAVYNSSLFNALGLTGKGVFTIIEVNNGWGKLKSGVGWIWLGNPQYCTINDTVKADTPTFSPYKVRVSIKDLNIRKGPGTNYASNGFCPVGVYTIIEESDGAGATKWGKLKSGAGWISLDYAKRV